MKLAIVGSRSITKEGIVAEAINHFNLKPGIIVSGGAKQNSTHRIQTGLPKVW